MKATASIGTIGTLAGCITGVGGADGSDSGDGGAGGANGGDSGGGDGADGEDDCAQDRRVCISILSSSTYINDCCRQAVAEIRNDNPVAVDFSVMHGVVVPEDEATSQDVEHGPYRGEATTQFAGILHPGERTAVKAQFPTKYQENEHFFKVTYAEELESTGSDYAGDLAVVDHSGVVDGDIYRVEGHVRNTGDHPLRTHLVVTLYDGAGTAVGMERINGVRGYNEGGDDTKDSYSIFIKPGQVNYFMMEVPTFDREIGSHAVGPEGEIWASQAKPIDLDAVAERAAAEGLIMSDGDPLAVTVEPLSRNGTDTEATLTIQNNGNTSLEITEVGATAHTDADTVFGSLFSADSDGKTVSAGASIEWVLGFDDPAGRIAAVDPAYALARPPS